MIDDLVGEIEEAINDWQTRADAYAGYASRAGAGPDRARHIAMSKTLQSCAGKLEQLLAQRRRSAADSLISEAIDPHCSDRFAHP